MCRWPSQDCPATACKLFTSLGVNLVPLIYECMFDQKKKNQMSYIPALRWLCRRCVNMLL